MQVHSQIGERIVDFLVPTLKPNELMKQSRSMVPTKHWVSGVSTNETQSA
jgi:hypothetical protein